MTENLSVNEFCQEGDAMNQRTNFPFDCQFVTVAEAAKMLRVSESWVYKAVKRKIFPCTRLSGRILIGDKQLDAYLSAMTIHLLPEGKDK